jgi:hypothetical protein
MSLCTIYCGLAHVCHQAWPSKSDKATFSLACHSVVTDRIAGLAVAPFKKRCQKPPDNFALSEAAQNKALHVQVSYQCN